MRFLLLLILFGAVGVVLYRLRSSRLNWVRELRLAGRWETEVDGRLLVLELHGGPDAGAYQESTRGEPGEHAGTEQGQWRIVGQALCFRPTGGTEERCELRAFGDGSIGLHGDRRRQRVYRRAAGNVVALRRDT